MKSYLSLIVALLLVAPSSFAGKTSIVGAVNYGLDSISAGIAGIANVSTKGGIGFGGGLLQGFGNFETGFLYLSRSFKSDIDVLGTITSTTTSVTSIEIPLMYRFGHSTSFGIGGFYDLAMTTGYTAQYGLTAGPRFGGTGKGMFLDLRFNYGLETGGSKNALALIGYAFN